MSRFYVYCRSWYGFTEKFPFYDELNCLPDDQFAMQLDARAVTWLHQNKEMVKARYREAKVELRRAIESVKRGAINRSSPRPHTGSEMGSPIRSFRTMYLERVRGPRRSPLAHRIARVAKWYHGGVIVGVSAPSPRLFLGWLPDGQLAKKVAESFIKYLDGLNWEELERIGCGVLPSNEVNEVEAARIALEIEELPNRTDSLSRLHNMIVTEYRKLISKLVLAERAEFTNLREDGPTPTVTAPPATNVSHGRTIERFVRAKQQLVACIREITARWIADDRDPSKLGLMGLGSEAAALAAKLGFPCPPIEYVTVWRPASHRLLEENPSWSFVLLFRVGDPATMLTFVEIPFSASTERPVAAPEKSIQELSVPPAAFAQVDRMLQSWRRYAEEIDPEHVQHRVEHYTDRKDSMEILSFRHQLARELQGKGDPTASEEAQHSLRAEELNRAGAAEAWLQTKKAFDTRYTVVAKLKHVPAVTMTAPEVQVDDPSSPTKGFFSASALAERHGVPHNKLPALRKRLERWRARALFGTDWIEHDAGARNEERFHYREKAVLHLISE